MISRELVDSWMSELKKAWEAGDLDGALSLFSKTEAYYERPFKAGTTAEEIQAYWKDIVGLSDIRLTYSIVAVEGDTACVHWENWFRADESAKLDHLDGVFVIEFDGDRNCRVFRQWWFMEP